MPPPNSYASSPQYIGYNVVGGSGEAMGGGSYTTFVKSVTPVNNCLLLSIGAHVKGNASNAHAFYPFVLADNAGAPGNIIGVVAGETVGSTQVANTAMSATLRWVQMPMVMPLTGGTAYWLGVIAGNGATIQYDSGSDYKVANNVTWCYDGSQTSYVAASRSYSIRGLVIDI